MELRLHKDKYQSTLKFFSFPLPIVNETRDVSGDLNRVFHSRNANFKNSFQNENAEAAAEELFREMKIPSYIQDIGRKVFKNKPNTFVLIDKDENGRAYLVTLYNENIQDVAFVDGSDVEVDYIQFAHSSYINNEGKKVKRIGYYDAESYRVVEVLGDTGTVTIKNPHQLKFCPARPFLSVPRSSQNSFDRFSPFAPVFGLLMNWTLFDCYLRYADHYSVYSAVEKAKDISEDDHCENGKTRRPLEGGNYSEWEDCKTCSSSKIIGPGTVVEIDPAVFKDEQDVSGMLRFVSPDIKNNEYAAKRQDARIVSLKKNTTGISQVMEKEAVNSEQVRSVIESARKPLLFMSSMLNDIDVWIHETAAKVSLNIDMSRYANWGTEWLLLSEGEIQNLFLAAKESGMPESELDELYKQLIETKYKANPDKIRSLIIQNNVNPAPYSTLEDCYTKKEKGVMSGINLDIKANVTSYIKRFERENGALSDFGSQAVKDGNKTFAEIVQEIYNTLVSYAKENESNSEPIEESSSAGSD